MAPLFAFPDITPLYRLLVEIMLISNVVIVLLIVVTAFLIRSKEKGKTPKTPQKIEIAPIGLINPKIYDYIGEDTLLRILIVTNTISFSILVLIVIALFSSKFRVIIKKVLSTI